jgi:spore coat protein H
MSKLFRAIVFGVMAVFLLFVSLLSMSGKGRDIGTNVGTVQKKLNQIDPSGVVVASSQGVEKVTRDINSMPLEDNHDLYLYDDPGSVVTMYLTVRRGNDNENTNHSWREVNDVTKYFFLTNRRVVATKTEAILQIGDENGPLPNELGYGEKVTNATVSIRGNSTSTQPQKSYKIMLFDTAGEWRGQKTINLNKSVFDPTRVKNKLAFDLIKDIPNMATMRTQFVHLYVKDETANPPVQVFEDYGLFTQIEQPNRRYLKNHLLDRYGQFYKANLFEFKRYPDIIRLVDDPLYNEDSFSTLLEVQGNRDHTKLIQMLEDINNYAIPIEQTFEKYFDEDNYFTWMAFNILVENVDTQAQNFYLYSPQNGQKWYFIPWDYDGAFDRQEDKDYISQFHVGISTYWNTTLHRRVLMVPENREKLDVKVKEVLDKLTPEKINRLLDIYRPVVDHYVVQMPDIRYLPETFDRHTELYNLLVREPQVNYELYVENINGPMPFFLATPQKVNSQLRFIWEESYDFNAQDINYHLQIATDWEFKNLVFEETLINKNNIDIPLLESGTYFWRVVATNESGKSMFPFDFYVDSIGRWHTGLKYLYISPEGEILEKQSE